MIFPIFSQVNVLKLLNQCSDFVSRKSNQFESLNSSNFQKKYFQLDRQRLFQHAVHRYVFYYFQKLFVSNKFHIQKMFQITNYFISNKTFSVFTLSLQPSNFRRLTYLSYPSLLKNNYAHYFNVHRRTPLITKSCPIITIIISILFSLPISLYLIVFKILRFQNFLYQIFELYVLQSPNI